MDDPSAVAIDPEKKHNPPGFRYLMWRHVMQKFCSLAKLYHQCIGQRPLVILIPDKGVLLEMSFES
jgi:hypothetical protein